MRLPHIDTHTHIYTHTHSLYFLNTYNKAIRNWFTFWPSPDLLRFLPVRCPSHLALGLADGDVQIWVRESGVEIDPVSKNLAKWRRVKHCFSPSSTASNCQLLTAVFPTGPQLQAPDRSVSSRWQCSPPDLNCQNLCHIQCQNFCQIECHNLCQIECQNFCQIEMSECMSDRMSACMPDRMSGSMSDRMSECMSDRMSECMSDRRYLCQIERHSLYVR